MVIRITSAASGGGKDGSLPLDEGGEEEEVVGVISNDSNNSWTRFGAQHIRRSDAQVRIRGR